MAENKAISMEHTMDKISVRINHQSGDSFKVSADTLYELVNKVYEECKKRNWLHKDCWTTEYEDKKQ